MPDLGTNFCGLVLATVAALATPVSAGETTLQERPAPGATLSVTTIADCIHVSRSSGIIGRDLHAKFGRDGTAIDLHMVSGSIDVVTI